MPFCWESKFCSGTKRIVRPNLLWKKPPVVVFEKKIPMKKWRELKKWNPTTRLKKEN